MIRMPLKRIFLWLIAIFIVGLLTVSFLPGLSKLMSLVGMAISFMLAGYFFYHDLTIQPELMTFLLWIAWSLTGVFVAFDMGNFYLAFPTIIQMGVLIFLVSGITSLNRNLTPVMAAIIIGVLILLILSFTRGEFGESIVNDEQAASITDNANIYAQYLIYYEFAILFFWKSNSGKWSFLLGIILAGLGIIGVIFSGSRQGFIGLLGFFILWFAFCHAKIILKKPVIAMAVLILFTTGLFFLGDYIMAHTYIGKKIRHTETRDVSRLNLYIEGLEMIEKHPVTGVGLNNFRNFSESHMYSHSDYIEVAANTGVIGFILYFAFYLILWRRLQRLQKKSSDQLLLYRIGLFKASIITILLLGFTKPNITSKITWIFLAGMAGYTWATEHVLQASSKGEFSHIKAGSKIGSL